MTIGERIRSRRKNLHLTLKDIFTKENIQTGNLSELENDKYLPSVQTLIALSRALDCSIDWILTGQEHNQTNNESLNIESLKSEQWLLCDGSPLTDIEGDVVAMYRLLPDSHKEELFDLIYFKYKRYVENKKESIYSTYSDVKEKQESASDDDDNTANETA